MLSDGIATVIGAQSEFDAVADLQLIEVHILQAAVVEEQIGRIEIDESVTALQVLYLTHVDSTFFHFQIVQAEWSAQRFFGCARNEELLCESIGLLNAVLNNVVHGQWYSRLIDNS